MSGGCGRIKLKIMIGVNEIEASGTVKWKTTPRRDAWARSRTKPSNICGSAVAQNGEAPREPEVLGLL